MAEGALPLSPRTRAARSIAVGAGFGVVAVLALLVALAFFAGAAFMALLDYLPPHLAALAVAGGSLTIAGVSALIGRALVSGGGERLRAALRTSALVAIAPHALRFGLRNARLVALASTAAATYFALRSTRKPD
jgi:hypothetical protein